MAKVTTPILGTHRIRVESVRVRVEVESRHLMVPAFEVDVPPEHRGDPAERAFVLQEIRKRCPGLRLELAEDVLRQGTVCNVCERLDDHWHCPKCGSDQVDNLGDGDGALCLAEGCGHEWEVANAAAAAHDEAVTQYHYRPEVLAGMDPLPRAIRIAMSQGLAHGLSPDQVADTVHTLVIAAMGDEIEVLVRKGIAAGGKG